MADQPKTDTPAKVEPKYTAEVFNMNYPERAGLSAGTYVEALVQKDGQPWQVFVAENRRKLTNTVKAAVQADKAGTSGETIEL